MTKPENHSENSNAAPDPVQADAKAAADTAKVDAEAKAKADAEVKERADAKAKADADAKAQAAAAVEAEAKAAAERAAKSEAAQKAEAIAIFETLTRHVEVLVHGDIDDAKKQLSAKYGLKVATDGPWTTVKMRGFEAQSLYGLSGALRNWQAAVRRAMRTEKAA